MIRHGDIESARNKESVRSALVPGLVDGVVTAALDQDGSISVHVTIGAPGLYQEEHAHIELVFEREHAAVLGETLLGVRGPRAAPADHKTPPVPCCIGIHIDFALSDG
jgi:hypothetical protein